MSRQAYTIDDDAAFPKDAPPHGKLVDRWLWSDPEKDLQRSHNTLQRFHVVIIIAIWKAPASPIEQPNNSAAIPEGCVSCNPKRFFMVVVVS